MKNRTTIIVRTVAAMVLLAAAPAAAARPDDAVAAVLAARQAQDLASLKRCRRSMSAVLDYLSTRSDLFAQPGAAAHHLPMHSTREDLVSAWASFQDTLTALDAIAAVHAHFRQLATPAQQRTSFHLYRAAIYTGYRFALDLLALLERNPALDTILNEPSPEMGLAAGSYARFKYRYLNVLQAATFAGFEALAEYFGPAGDSDLADAVESDRRRIWDAGKGPGPAMTVKNGWAIVQHFTQSAWLPVQKGVAEWMGDTKVHRIGRSLITDRQVAGFAPRLQPGDILLERREWYMTNVGIPGFWTHAALYVGTADDRRGFFDDPETTAWVEAQGAADLESLLAAAYPEAYADSLLPREDGRLPAVIEAVSEGVVFTSLAHSAGCDSLAVLRPRLSNAARARAIYQAFRYQGRPYDYNFDFVTDGSLVCTELIYKSYAPDGDRPGLTLPLEKMMGHMVTPANAIARDFQRRYQSGDPQMDLVLFVDGNEKTGTAAEADLPAFLETWKRPKWHVLAQ